MMSPTSGRIRFIGLCNPATAGVLNSVEALREAPLQGISVGIDCYWEAISSGIGVLTAFLGKRPDQT
jgi:hypothetical protein